jgi:biotin carboxylase
MYEGKKLAIIGASYLQLPLIRKAKQLGIETHVFAWKCDDVGEKEADHFYPVSIIEKDKILETCRIIKIDGICSIASDLAVLTVCYVAEKMGLTGNGIASSQISVNKYLMKKAFMDNNIPAAKFILTDGIVIPDVSTLKYPLIVKPTDRSGSRGVTRLDSSSESLKDAIEKAIEQSLEKKALVEEFIPGTEYSVECLSFDGNHRCLSVTKKYTTGNPHYIEIGHLEPSDLDEKQIEEITEIVFKGLDSLNIKYGASHSELKVFGNEIKIIEIGARMGGDMIGSSLVNLSTGYDFVKAVIDISLGNKPDSISEGTHKTAAIRYITDEEAETNLKVIKNRYPEILVEVNEQGGRNSEIFDSSTRKGYYIIASYDRECIISFMPECR